MRRAFIETGGRRLHLRLSGRGPAILLIHGSPGNAAMLYPLVERLESRFAVFAFDTPGFGLSDALEGASLEVADVARALATAIEGLGVSRYAVFGTHTGAAVGLELAACRPRAVTQVVLEGVPIFTPAEQEPLLSDQYMPPFAPEDLGGHFAATWTRFRDQHVWFPWFAREPVNRIKDDLGTPEDIHRWCEMFYDAADRYKPAYRAAISYGEKAGKAAHALKCPALFLAEAHDMLFAHLDRLPPCVPDQSVLRLPIGEKGKWSAVEQALLSGPHGDVIDTNEIACRARGSGFVDLAHGQVHVRWAGTGAPRILVLHDVPGTSLDALDGRWRDFANAAVIPDLPGCGLSDPLPGESPSLADFADAVASLMEGVGATSIFATGLGAALACEVAHRHPGRVSKLFIERWPGRVEIDPKTGAPRLTPPITIDPDGGHWYRTWLMLRDRLIYHPWYEHHFSHARQEPASFDASTLHEQTRAVMRQHRTYGQLATCLAGQELDALKTDLPVEVEVLN